IYSEIRFTLLSKVKTIYDTFFFTNLCVSMLQEGFHLSFEKFFSLLKRSRASRLPLEDQHHKLEMLREHLTRAEGAERAGQYEVVCDGYSALAGFFSGSGDEWLQEFFFHLGFFSSCRIKSDGGRREAEARAHLGHLHLKRGELDQALEHYGKYQCLVAGQPWRDEGGRSYQSRGEEGLCRIYFLLSEKHLQNNENQRAAEILTNAYYITKQGTHTHTLNTHTLYTHYTHTHTLYTHTHYTHTHTHTHTHTKHTHTIHTHTLYTLHTHTLYTHYTHTHTHTHTHVIHILYTHTYL
uniref:Uncharacterized protein n=1 Tax=Astyanax mexicanus TaxID=7994 RepID=A0A3B1JKL0_ASTMX